jgi:hypothetical protein
MVSTSATGLLVGWSGLRAGVSNSKTLEAEVLGCPEAHVAGVDLPSAWARIGRLQRNSGSTSIDRQRFWKRSSLRNEDSRVLAGEPIVKLL